MRSGKSAIGRRMASEHGMAMLVTEADIQKAVFVALGGQTVEAQRLWRAVWRLVQRYKTPSPQSGPIPRPYRALRSADARRKTLERLARRAFLLARDIAQVEQDGPLSGAFEELFRRSLDGKPPGFPETGLILEQGDLGRQFFETLALAHAAKYLRKSWRASKAGRPSKTRRNEFIKALAREYQEATGMVPSGRRRDQFSNIAGLALRASGFPLTDARDAISSALSSPDSKLRTVFIVEPKLREIPKLGERAGKK
jgi:hypothetical protein